MIIYEGPPNFFSGRYAGLYFTFCVDANDNELAMLELIHLFVEILDGYFRNVCELDLVFQFDKVQRFAEGTSPQQAKDCTSDTCGVVVL